MFGDFLDKDERYARCDEFLEIVRRLWAGETVDLRRRAPPGRGRRGSRAAARPGPGDLLRRLLARGRSTSRRSTPTSTSPGASRPRPSRRRSRWIRELAAAAGSRRSASASACTPSTATPPRRRGREADRLLAGIDDATIATVQEGLKRSPSPSASDMLALNGGRRDDLEIHPNVWAGVGLVRGGAGTALVGSHEEVADRIEEYAALGIDEFVLSAYPHLEGAYYFGEGVLPVLAERGVWTHPAPGRSQPRRAPFGAHRGGLVTSIDRVAVLVGNPKPASRTLTSAQYVATQLADRTPDLVVDLADHGAGALRLAGPRRSPSWSARSSASRAGGRRQPDLQGDLHRSAQAVPRPLRRRLARRRYRGPADARRRHRRTRSPPSTGLRPLLVELGAPCRLRGLYVARHGVRRPRGVRRLARPRPGPRPPLLDSRQECPA